MDIMQFIREHYFNTVPVGVQPIAKGEENQNYLISTDSERFVLRLYSLKHSTTGPRRRQDIDFELDFIDFADGRDVPTARVIPTLSGAKIAETCLDGQIRFAVLFAFSGGEEAAAYNERNARSTARLLGKMRGASLAYRYGAVRAWPGDIIQLSLDFYQQHRQQIAKYQGVLDNLYQQAVKGYAAVQNERLPRGIIHGDIKLGNLLFEGDEVTAVLDFDDYRESYLLEEVTRTLLHDLDSPARNAVRSGYYNVFHEALENDPTITAAELAHLSTFLRARLVYDITTYLLHGDYRLADEVLEDQHIAEVI